MPDMDNKTNQKAFRKLFDDNFDELRGSGFSRLTSFFTALKLALKGTSLLEA